MERIVNIGDCVFSSEPDDVIKTYGLSTCLAVVVYSKLKRVMGMAHIALPYPQENQPSSLKLPARYAGEAVPFIFETMQYKYGCMPKSLQISLFGAIEAGDEDYFQIGRRNLSVVLGMFERYGVSCDSSETGGYVARTIFGYVSDGSIQLLRTPIR